MQTVMTTRTTTDMSPEQLTAAIRQEHEAASKAARSALEHALAAGLLLAQAKRKIPHGSWESFVRDSCGIAPRTARLYQRLYRHRDRLPDRQHVAELSVRQAARLLERPKPEAVLPPVASELAEQDDELLLRVPGWYRAGHRHFGKHPSGWFFEVWPHPAGEQWAHFFICSPASSYPGDESSTLVGPKRGIRVDAIERVMSIQTSNGMPSLDDDEWTIGGRPCEMDDEAEGIASRGKEYNTLLFAGDTDYKRRALGIKRPGDVDRRSRLPAEHADSDTGSSVEPTRRQQ